jgi:hypothetical protein
MQRRARNPASGAFAWASNFSSFSTRSTTMGGGTVLLLRSWYGLNSTSTLILLIFPSEALQTSVCIRLFESSLTKVASILIKLGVWTPAFCSLTSV